MYNSIVGKDNEMKKYKDMTKDERREYIDAILKSHIQDTTWSSLLREFLDLFESFCIPHFKDVLPIIVKFVITVFPTA